MAGVTGTNGADAAGTAGAATAPAGPPGRHAQAADSPSSPAGASSTAGTSTAVDLVKHDRPAGQTERALLRRLFSDRVLALSVTAHDRLWGWLGPLLVAVVAGVVRFVNLGTPSTLVFDETYYVKGAYTLLTLGYEADWPDEPNPAFESGNQDSFLTAADYVVHPPVGKWMIALGMWLGGPENPWAWRLASAVVGVVAVFVLARTARRIFGSTVFGVVAGGLMAVDGVAVVHSRTGLLDVFLMFWVVVAFALLVKDREWFRRRLAARSAELIDSGRGVGRDGPVVGVRWWRLAAAVALGLACGTKWSGLYFVAVFCLVSVAWDASARRAVGARQWHVGSLLLDAVPAAAAMLPTVLVTYLVSWSAWFANPRSYDRQWSVENPGSYPGWLPDVVTGWGEALRSFWHYHEKMLSFHTGLDNPHTYMANPWGWLLQLRPTSFYWRKTESFEGGCGAEACARAITSVGNPLIWWLATAAVVVALYALVVRRDWRAVAVLSGIVAGWVPWLFFPERTIFTFYTIAFAPWMYLTLTFALVLVWEQVHDDARLRRRAAWVIGALLTLVVLVSAFFYPVWTAMEIPHSLWRAHMWLPSWV
jgi:dolichyl-phosphate-mannose-protein mannosyltransferase